MNPAQQLPLILVNRWPYAWVVAECDVHVEQYLAFAGCLVHDLQVEAHPHQ